MKKRYYVKTEWEYETTFFAFFPGVIFMVLGLIYIENRKIDGIFTIIGIFITGGLLTYIVDVIICYLFTRKRYVELK